MPMSSMTIVVLMFALVLVIGGCSASGRPDPDLPAGAAPAKAAPVSTEPEKPAPATPTPAATKVANTSPERVSIDTLLDKLHVSAASANADAYWACYTDNAVFIGTDASERWTLTEFKEYAEPHFATGKGWAYTPSNRHVDFSPDRRTAWFDETVTHAQYGACRGTGVLLLTPSGWKVAQYHLTLPIPNDLLPEEAEKIKKYLAEPRKEPRHDE